MSEAASISGMGSMPSSTPPILMAARQTVAMIITLKKKPRYRARKPRRKAAVLPL